MRTIKTLNIFFKNELTSHEISYFRGAVNAALEENHSLLFHNHTLDGFRYSYPLIQYKRINKKAAIVCIEDGTEAIGEFFNIDMRPFSIGNKKEEMVIGNIVANQFLVQVGQTTYKYKLCNWLPFNAENYKAYQSLERVAEKANLMERVLIGNILSFLKGVNIFIEEQITCHITDIKDPHTIHYKGIKLMSFNIDFSTNISLPPLIGLGKGASLGYGIVIKNKKNEQGKISLWCSSSRHSRLYLSNERFEGYCRCE